MPEPIDDRSTPRYVVISLDQRDALWTDEHHAIYDNRLERKIAGTTKVAWARTICNALNDLHKYEREDYASRD